MTSKPALIDAGAWIAQRIRDERERQGLTQAQLAARLGRTQTAISYWESGKRMPGLDDLIELSEALERDIFVFLPPPQLHQPVGALLRAEAQRIASSELDEAIDQLLVDAEVQVHPSPTLEVKSKQPSYAANELLERAGVDSPPTPIERLAAACGVLVLTREFPDSLSGLILQTESGPVVGINKRHAGVRRRFTLAHELGHLLLGHAEGVHIDISEGHRPGYDYRLERAANEFAADLLMPRRHVAAAFQARPDPPTLARAFEVSEIAMGYRLIDLGLR